MLDYLHIKNVALIDEQLINFGEGFNILTGETGAGKSMIIDSLSFVLGEKVSKDFIRTGEENALVEALFFLKSPKIIEEAKKLGVEPDAYDSVLLSREMNKNGRTISKINGKVATMNMIKDLSEILIDIHGQHEHQSLLDPTKHIVLLDKFCGNDLHTLKERLHTEYKAYKEIQNNIFKLTGDESQRAQKIDILQFQTSEIETAKIRVGEEEELLTQRKLLLGAEKLTRGIGEANILLNGGEDETKGAVEQIYCVSDLLRDLKAIDVSLEEIYNAVENLKIQVDEVALDIRHYDKENDNDPQILYEIEKRLDLLHLLKKKYGSTEQEILDSYQAKKQELDFILNGEEELNKLNKQLETQKTKIEVLCEDISKIRQKKAKEIQKQIENVLCELEMKSAKFGIDIMKNDDFTENGWDKIEFMISANAGEPQRPLAKIASGGEMSRVMLALKTVLADVDSIETLIFDEIDTGVSGRTAQKVGEKMAFISHSHQVLCITHLPQIAAMADNHYMIEKKEQKGKTNTKVYDLTTEQSVLELARLIGGAEITQTTITAAKEMKQLAKK